MSQECWVETTCDRCGKLDRSADDEVDKDQLPRGWRFVEGMDLCDACVSSFVEWKQLVKESV